MLKLLYKVGETPRTSSRRDLIPMASTASLVRCSCSLFVAIDAAGRETRLSCTATTRRTFAPGHDAKLKGFLIRAGRDGMHVREVGRGVAHDQHPTQVADRFGFGHMVRDGIARVAKPRKAAKVAAPRTVRGKVGRWVYEGTVTAGGGIFTYTDRQGRTLMAEKFTVVG